MTNEQKDAIETAKLLAFINVVFTKDYKGITKIEDNNINYIFHVIDATHESGKWQHIVSKEWFDDVLKEFNKILVKETEMAA